MNRILPTEGKIEALMKWDDQLLENVAAMERLVVLEKDAARYRWLRSQDSLKLTCIAYRVPEACKHNEPDAAIDAAIAAQEAPKDGVRKPAN